MKKICLLFSLSGAVLFSNAQDLVSAYNANKAGKFEEAVTYIEKSSTEPKNLAKEKYWRYRGDIYLNVAANPDLAAKYPNASQIAKESFFKQMEIDTHKDYIVEVTAALGQVQGVILEKAQNQYAASDFCNAAENFVGAREISDKFAVVDSGAIFNAAYCYDRCGNLEKAIAGYEKCASINYSVPAVYMYMADLYTKNGKKEEAKKVLIDARAKYPKDAALLRSEVNIYLSDESYDKAEQLLLSLVEADAKNEMIWFVLGVTYEKLGKGGEEEKAYAKALEIKPDYYDALFNLGAMYFNDGLEKEKLCNEIPPREKAKYDDCIGQTKVMFSKAVGNLEAAYKIKPEEKEIIAALKDAYYKAENIEGYNKMKALMKP
jgi:tetratricopeptide (TPR) repeat protein